MTTSSVPGEFLTISDSDRTQRAYSRKRLACRNRDMARAAKLMKALANEKRLAIVCRLAAAGEMCVHALATAAGLSSSAMSQHLAVLRHSQIVAARREAQTIHYRLADARVGRLLGVLLIAGGEGSSRKALSDEQ